MNFLAHTFLSFDVPPLIVGNYLGDFVKNDDIPRFPLEVQRGIYLHRAIDSFTDQSDDFKRGTRMLHQPLGKYSPVVLDIYFDFLLSKNWELYHDDTLSSVCARAYQALNTYDSYMPDNLRFRISKMTEDRWLENYGTYPGLTRVFSFLHRRTSFPSRLDEASAILQPLEPELDQVFRDFFPQLVEFARLEIQDL